MVERDIEMDSLGISALNTLCSFIYSGFNSKIEAAYPNHMFPNMYLELLSKHSYFVY